MPPKPVMLVILDGFGWREATADNAVRLARAPNFAALWSGSPHAFLHTSGRDVGLPAGNSAVPSGCSDAYLLMHLGMSNQIIRI